MLEKPGQFDLELDPFPDAVIEIEERRLVERFVPEPFEREGEVELAVAVPWGARVVCEQGRTSLCEQRGDQPDHVLL